MRRTNYRYCNKPIHQLQAHRRKLRLIRLYGEWNGTLTRKLLNKKGVSNALLNQLEILGLVRPVRSGGVVEYRISELRNCYRELLRREIYLKWCLRDGKGYIWI